MAGLAAPEMPLVVLVEAAMDKEVVEAEVEADTQAEMAVDKPAAAVRITPAQTRSMKAG